MSSASSTSVHPRTGQLLPGQPTVISRTPTISPSGEVHARSNHSTR
ncbi:hypothetical protein [Ornithinimicrobium kibberense]